MLLLDQSLVLPYQEHHSIHNSKPFFICLEQSQFYHQTMTCILFIAYWYIVFYMPCVMYFRPQFVQDIVLAPWYVV